MMVRSTVLEGCLLLGVHAFTSNQSIKSQPRSVTAGDKPAVLPQRL